MAYCTRCGANIADDARFCPHCGQPYGTPGVVPPMAGPVATPLDYTIQGDNLQVVRIKLQPGQELYAEAGKMLYKTPSVQWETRMSGGSIGEKLWGALKRTVMGESLFLTYFRANQPGEVGFAGNYPGRLQPFTLAAGQSVLVQRDSFVAAQSTVQLNIALVKKLGAGFFGGEGFVLERLTGPGTVFIHGGGDFIDFTLGPGEVLRWTRGAWWRLKRASTTTFSSWAGSKRQFLAGKGCFWRL